MKTAFSYIIVCLAAAFCFAEQQELTKDNCMHFCTEEIENIVFTTESLKSSMQTTIDNLRVELEKIQYESDSKDALIEKARSERSVWKSKSDALQMQMIDIRKQVQRKNQEVEHYRSFLDEKEKAKMDEAEANKDEAERKAKERYEKKLKLDAEMQERMEKRRAKGLDPHGEDDDEEEDLKPEPGSKKYFLRTIENLEFTMESVLKSSHNCQHQLSQCLGNEIHPLLQAAYSVQEALETELNKFVTSRMNINWCLVKHDISYMLSYVGFGSAENKCLTTNDIKKNGPKYQRSQDSVQLPPEHLAAQAQARAAQGAGGFGMGMGGTAFGRSF